MIRKIITMLLPIETMVLSLTDIKNNKSNKLGDQHLNDEPVAICWKGNLKCVNKNKISHSYTIYVLYIHIIYV